MGSEGGACHPLYNSEHNTSGDKESTPPGNLIRMKIICSFRQTNKIIGCNKVKRYIFISIQ